MVNDLIWLEQTEGGAEHIAVCYSKLDEQKDPISEGLDYFVGVYQNEKRTVTKSFRSEIKRIVADDRDHNVIYGGIENGRIALWDLRTQKPAPDAMSSPKDKISFMPVIDLKKRENDIFSVALEGRIHKFDARKFYEPVFSMDMFVMSESHTIVKLESMPTSLEFDPLDPEILYVTTTEGTIYEIGINQNSFQEKQIFQRIANAPVTNLKFMDFKNFFKDIPTMRKTGSGRIKASNFFVTSSFDWNVKFFKESLGNEVAVNNYHNDFVTALDVNNQLCPFTYASGDVEGKLAVWKVDQNYTTQPVIEWSTPQAISKVRWNHSGLQLAVGDVRGGVNILTFAKSKLMISEKMMNYYSSHGLGKLMSD
jgi:WD40 repeat protein